MLATLIGSRWRDCESRMHSEIECVALMLHQIFVYSATLSMIPAKLAMKLKLPVWTKFMKTVDTILEKVRNLVPEMIRMSSDGLLQIIMSYGIHDDDAVRIITDFIIAAGDTVRFFNLSTYTGCSVICQNLTKKKGIIGFPILKQILFRYKAFL